MIPTCSPPDNGKPLALPDQRGETRTSEKSLTRHAPESRLLHKFNFWYAEVLAKWAREHGREVRL